MTNGAGHQCHAGTIEIERPIKDGIRFQAYSMLTRDIGRLEDGESPEDSNDRKRERAVRMDIPTHRLAANFVRELPMGEGHPLLAEAGRVLNALVSGWQVSAAYILRSGMFLTPRWTGPDPNGRRFTSSRPPPSVTLRPDILRKPNLPHPTLNRWFDMGAFAPPQPGAFGTPAKSVIIGPGVRVMHANLAGITGLGERFRLRTEIIASNGLNHPNYETQGLDISNLAAAGVITAVQHRNANMDTSIPRYVRLATRIQWQLPAGGGDRPAAPPPATSAAPRPQRPPNRAAT